MHRELGDERARYGRMTFREQVGDVLAWPGSHRFATGIIAVVVVGAVAIAALSGRAQDPRSLAIGDCLYVPTPAALDPTASRPIGSPGDIELLVIAGDAQKASCAASHGHEVSAILVGPDASPRGSGTGELFDRDAIHRLMQPLCDAAFAAYVGRPLDSSAFDTFPAVPEAPAWVAGGRRTICLVARTDGTWMDHPAQGSGE
jgi:Septum formation